MENALEEFLQDSDDDEGGEVDADEDAEELRKLQEEGIGVQKKTAGGAGGKPGEAAPEEANSTGGGAHAESKSAWWAESKEI